MSVVRVKYRERQRLKTADLRAEQDYRLGLAGRHHLSHHRWGVVRGLRVVSNYHGGFTLTSGVAIDGYGREILVREPVDLEIDDTNLCSYVVLYYCEYPEQLPPGRACRDEPAPRIAQRAKWIASDAALPPTDIADAEGIDELERARSAGVLTGLPPWPVLVAKVGLNCTPSDPDAPLEVYSSTRYVWHRASLVHAPTARARLKLGLENRTDIYPVLLSTLDGRALAARVGIDRDGVTHVWKPLVISGAEAFGQVVVAERKLLKVASVMPGGIGNRVRLTGLLDVSQHVLSASLTDIGATGPLSRPTLRAAHDIKVNRPLEAALQFQDRRKATFNLVDAFSFEPIALRDARHRTKEKLPREPAPPDVERFAVDLKPAGGMLTMRQLDRTIETPVVACGDIGRIRSGDAALGSPVVQLRPAATIVDDARAREIYAVTTSKASESVPRTELRVSGGAEDKTDVSTRLSAGAWRTDKGQTFWVPRLRMDGGRRIDILAEADIGAGVPGKALEVKETVYLPAIGKDDPLLPEMMAMAFMAGLRQIGRVASTTTVTLTSPGGASVVRGSTLKFDADIHYPNERVLRRSIETIRGSAGTGDLAFRSMTEVVLPAGTSNVFHIKVDNFRHSASKVGVQVVLLVTESNIPKLAISNVLDFSVVDS